MLDFNGVSLQDRKIGRLYGRSEMLKKYWWGVGVLLGAAGVWPAWSAALGLALIAFVTLSILGLYGNHA